MRGQDCSSIQRLGVCQQQLAGAIPRCSMRPKPVAPASAAWFRPIAVKDFAGWQHAVSAPQQRGDAQLLSQGALYITDALMR